MSSTQTVAKVVTKTATKTAAKTAAIVGSEAALIESGIGIPVAFLEAAILGLFKLGKFIHQKKQDKKDKEADQKAQEDKAKADRELQQQADESARIQLQKEQEQKAIDDQKALDDENLSKKEKADAQKKLDDEKAAAQKKIDDEAKQKLSDEEKAKQAEIERQRQLDIKHQQEDQQLENEQQNQAQNIQNRNVQIQDQLAYERQQRLTPGEIPSSLVPAASNSGRYDEYGRPIREGGNFQPQQPYRPMPMPDEPPGGGGNNPGGNGGNDNPDPNGNNDDPNRNEELVYPPGYGPQNRNPSQSNPYADVLWQLAKQINDNKNKEEKAVLDKKQEEESKAPAPNLQPTNPEGDKPIDPNIDPGQKPLGSDPNTWSPTGKKNVPEDPSQLVKPAYSEAHLVENQLLAILNAQGLGELTSEDSLRQLTKIEADMPKPVKIDSNSVYSSVLAPF